MRKSPSKNHKLASPPVKTEVACSSITVTKFEPTANLGDHKLTHQKLSPDPLQHKYEIPFNEDTDKKQRFLKKGSNITGMILQHIFKG
jgi:hypothetical protein